MLYLVLALNFAAFSVNAGLLILTILTYKKTGQRALHDASLVLFAVILILFVDAIRTFAVTPEGAIEAVVPFISIPLTCIGSGLLAYALPQFACRLVRLTVSPIRWVFHAAFIVALVVLGILKEAMGGELVSAFEGATFGLIHIYAGAVIIVFFKKIEDKVVRSIVKTFLTLLAVIIVLTAVQPPLLMLLDIPSRWRDVPYTQLLYSLFASTLMIYYASRHLYSPETTGACVLPEDFVGKFGISERECEIITLVMQGHSHKQIGDRLYISARTVKNHIYNIYQKTGAENKVQLMNLIHPDRI